MGRQTRVRALRLAIATLLLSCVSFMYAQAQGGGTSSGKTGTSTSTPKSSKPKTDTPASKEVGTVQPRQAPLPIMKPAFLHGNVVFNDGTPAPADVLIGCSGKVGGLERRTDAKGRFRLSATRTSRIGSSRLARQSGGIAQRTASRGQGNFDSNGSLGVTSAGMLTGCRLRAYHPGYRSSTIDVTGHWIDNPNIGTLILTPLATVEGLTVSATSLLASEKAQKALARGKKEFEKQNWNKALKEFQKAVDNYADYSEAWFEMGRSWEAVNQAAEARQAYGESMAADPNYLGPYVRLALLDLGAGRWEEAVTSTRQVLKLNPYDFPEVYYYDAVANLKLGNFAAAEQSARELIELDEHRRFPQVEQILGMSLAYQDNFAEAAIHLKKYLELLPQAPNAEQVKQHLAQVESAVVAQQR